MITQTTSTYSSSLLEIVARGHNFSRGSRICALNILAGVTPGLSDTPKLTCVINDLTSVIREESSDYLHEALSTLDHILNTEYPLPLDFDYFRTLNDLIATLEKTTVPKTQRKITLVMSTLLTHILLNAKTQKETKVMTIGLIADEKRESMKEVLERLTQIKKKEQKSLSSEDSFHTNYLLSYNIEALKLLATDKSSKEKSFEAAILILGGLTSIVADKKVVTGLLMFKEAFDLIDLKKGWFPMALGLKGLELKGAKTDLNATKQLIEQVKATLAKKNEETTYQGLLSLSRTALLGETLEIRQMAAAPLEKIKESKKPELIQGYMRHLAKVANHGKTEDERVRAKEALLSLEVKGRYAESKKDGVRTGSDKQKATARKMEGFRKFDSEAEKILRPAPLPQTPPKAINKEGEASGHMANSSPQGSPPPSDPSSLSKAAQTPVKYRAAKPQEALFARVVGSSWDNFWKTWLKFEAECVTANDVDVNSLSIRGQNASEMRWNAKSFELAAKFFNEDKSVQYKKFDLSFSDYNVDELADFLPQLDNRSEIELVLRGEADYTALAKELYKKGLYAISKNMLEKAGERNPSFMESSDFLVRLGQVYDTIKEPNNKEAESFYKKSISKNPNHFLTWFHYSFFLKKAKRLKESCDAARKAVKLNNNNANAHYTLAQNLTLLYEVEKKDRDLIQEAKKEIDIANDLNKNDKETILVKSIIDKMI